MLTYLGTIRRIVDIILVAILGAFAFYSFRDAFRFRNTRNREDITFQLPEKVRRTIRRVLRAGLVRKRAQVASGLVAGIVVTALESVCTGQVYIPTLAFVVKTGVNLTRGLTYLMLYNLMFVMPLIVVLLLTHQGLKLTTLIEWSVRNVFLSKLLTGCFFVMLAAAVILWAVTAG